MLFNIGRCLLGEKRWGLLYPNAVSQCCTVPLHLALIPTPLSPNRGSRLAPENGHCRGSFTKAGYGRVETLPFESSTFDNFLTNVLNSLP